MPALPEKQTTTKPQAPSLQRRDNILEAATLKKSFSDSLDKNKQLKRLDKNIDDMFKLWVMKNKTASETNNINNELIGTIDILQKSIVSATEVFKSKPELTEDDIKALSSAIAVLSKKIEIIDDNKSKDIINSSILSQLENLVSSIQQKPNTPVVNVEVPVDTNSQKIEEILKEQSVLFVKFMEAQDKAKKASTTSTTIKNPDIVSEKDVTFKGNLSNTLFGTKDSMLGNWFNKKLGISDKDKGILSNTQTTNVKGEIGNALGESKLADKVRGTLDISDTDMGKVIPELATTTTDNGISTDLAVASNGVEPLTESESDLAASMANDAADLQMAKADEFNKATLSYYDNEINLLTEIRDILKEQSGNNKRNKKIPNDVSDSNKDEENEDDGVDLDLDIDLDRDKKKNNRKSRRNSRSRGKGRAAKALAKQAAKQGIKKGAGMAAGAAIGGVAATGLAVAGAGLLAYEGTSYLMENTETGKNITANLEEALYSTTPGTDEARMAVDIGAIEDPVGWGTWKIKDKEKLLKNFTSKELTNMSSSDKFDEATQKELYSIAMQKMKIESEKKPKVTKPEIAKPIEVANIKDLQLSPDTPKLLKDLPISTSEDKSNQILLKDIVSSAESTKLNTPSNVDTLTVAPIKHDDSINKMKKELHIEKTTSNEKLNETLTNLNKTVETTKTDTGINTKENLKDSFTNLEKLLQELIDAVNNSKSSSTTTEIEIPLLKEKRASL